MALWMRDDYEFRDPEDFMKVCYGFARNILHADSRALQRDQRSDPVDQALRAFAPPPGNLQTADLKILLDEVLRTGQAELSAKDWALIRKAANALMSGEDYHFDAKSANKLRVQLHRLRKKLSDLTGWRSK